MIRKMKCKDGSSMWVNMGPDTSMYAEEPDLPT